MRRRGVNSQDEAVIYRVLDVITILFIACFLLGAAVSHHRKPVTNIATRIAGTTYTSLQWSKHCTTQPPRILPSRRLFPQGDYIFLLVSHGADTEAKDSNGLRPLHYAAKAGRHVALLALLTAGADPYGASPRCWNALHFAVAGGNAKATRLLAYRDSDSGFLARQKNGAGARPIDLGRCGGHRGSI